MIITTKVRVINMSDDIVYQVGDIFFLGRTLDKLQFSF